MTQQEIRTHVKALFEPTVSPGQAFDTLFLLRQHRVGFGSVVEALSASPATLDEREDGAQPHAAHFTNPHLTFGKYKDKALLDVMKINPGYVKWLSTDSTNPFWKQQATLALDQGVTPKLL